jgi:hypothetical protein
MAIIYSYPKKTTPNAGDFLVITDSAQPAPNKNRTKSLTVGDLATYVITSQSAITGSGTLNTIPIFTGSTTIGDSIMTFTTVPDTITVGGRLSITGDLVVGNRSTFAGYARFNGEVRDAANSSGTAGQVLSSTGAGTVAWADDATGSMRDWRLTGDTGGVISTVTDNDLVNFQGGTKITTGASLSDTLAIIHDNTTRVDTTSSVAPIAGATFTVIDSVTQDATGHPTAVNVKTVTLPADAGGTVTGTGTVNKLTKWSSGGTGIQNSNITDNGSLVTIASETNQTGKAVFRNGIVLSNNPGGITVDDTSMVIGAGNNDIISGADHCLAVGNNNQILTNSDNSISVGQGNTMTFGTACAVFGLSNTITGSNTVTERCLVAGFSNTISGGAKSAIVLGGSNSLTTNGGQGIILGNANTVTGNAGVSNDSSYILGNNVLITEDPSTALLQNAFAVGSNLCGADGTMVLGYRNLCGVFYPPVNYNQGLGETKFVVAVGTTNTTNSNALIITEGGVTRGTSSVAQVPRIVMPTVVGFNFADDTAAATGGIPIGGLYHNAGALRIRLT